MDGRAVGWTDRKFTETGVGLDRRLDGSCMDLNPSQARPSQAKPSQAKPSQAKPSPALPCPIHSEISQCMLCVYGWFAASHKQDAAPRLDAAAGMDGVGKHEEEQKGNRK